jgi:intracellular septation protein
MKIFLDFLPIILFFIAYKTHGIEVATGVAIAASILQICYMLLRKQKVETMQWASLGIICVFGGLTLWFHNATFIKLKPTVLYALFGLGLLVSRYGFGKNGIKALMGKQMQLPEPIWDRANFLWVAFFLFMSGLNTFVAFNYSEETWVNFKLFGTMGLTLVFIIGQALYLGKYSAQNQEIIQAPASDPATDEKSPNQTPKK